MNLAKIFLLVFPVFLIHSTALSISDTLKFNSAIENWKNQITEKENVIVLYENVTLVKSMIKAVANNRALLDEIYFLSLDTLENSNDIYAALDVQTLHKIFSYIYSFSIVFVRHVTTEELVRFFYSSIECVFRYGTDWSFSNILIDPPNNEILMEIIEFIGKFFIEGETLKEKDAVKCFYFHYAEMANNRGLMSTLVASEHVMNSLLFLHKYSEARSPYFHQWVKLYFPFIHRIFDGHLEEPSKLKALLDLSKQFVDETDVDWAVLLFTANNIANFIYTNPLLLAKALDNIIFLMEKYPDRFMACVELLGIRRAKKLFDEIENRKLKKSQISTALAIRKLLLQLKLDAEISIEESLKKWQTALETLNMIKFDDLSKKDFESIGETIKDSYENLYLDYQENETEQVVCVLNAYIPINVKLNIFHKIDLHAAQNISSKFADILALKFSQRKEEINLRDIAEYINSFHGSVFNNHELVFHLNKFTMYWRMNIFSFKVFIEFLDKIKWLNDQIAIINLQYRVIQFLDSSNRNTHERTEIDEIINYLQNDLKFLSKTEVLILNKIF